jgi:hypothetical protein
MARVDLLPSARRSERHRSHVDGVRDQSGRHRLDDARPGVAIGRPDHLEAAGDAPVAQAPGPYPALRYAAVVEDGDRTAVYYEAGCEDGSHELRREWFTLAGAGPCRRDRK